MNSQIKTLPVNYSIDIWKESWNIIKGKRLSFFFAAFFMIFVAMPLSFIPIIGLPLTGFLSVFLSAGFMIVIHTFDLKKEFSFNSLLSPLTDRNLFDKLLPLAVFLLVWNGLLALFRTSFGGAGIEVALFGSLIWVVGGLIVNIFTYFAIPLMLFENKTLFESMSLSTTALAKNALMFLAYSFVTGFILSISLIPLGIGFILLFAPFTCHGYLFYKRIFQEGREDKYFFIEE